ncbi:MAG TPA: hypothetical protein VHP14_18595, partial [Anaerolineales bacterium]|nr:hypothetical protein [Anaerolineales bacterium]
DLFLTSAGQRDHDPVRMIQNALDIRCRFPIQHCLEQLKQVELAPFFAVTSSTNAAELADGLLVSHIRYQGFQGNIRATTRPVSLDEPALSAIISLDEFKTWRANNGLIVSDALGSQAVRDF